MEMKRIATGEDDVREKSKVAIRTQGLPLSKKKTRKRKWKKQKSIVETQTGLVIGSQGTQTTQVHQTTVMTRTEASEK